MTQSDEVRTNRQTQVVDWMRERDPGMRQILAEFVESANAATDLWNAAASAIEKDCSKSLALTVELQVLLEHSARPEVDDIIATVIEASARIDASLDDDA